MYTPYSPGQFGQWLKQRRRELDLTQEELALRIGCSYMAIHKIESGARRPSKQIAELLAHFFDVPGGEQENFVKFARGVEDATAPDFTTGQGQQQGRPGNLPIPLTRLIGREEIVGVLCSILVPMPVAGRAPGEFEVRLLTLTGPPGIGKTRLSIETGRALLDHFKDGVYFVSLAALSDPESVSFAIAHTLGVRDTATLSPGEYLTQFLREKQALLVLDNFEHVLDAGPLVLNLLRECPDLKAMITSREALNVQGEQQFPVPSLATTNAEKLPTIENMQRVPALALFVERARAVRPGFALTEENAAAVAAICTRLDGLPLAIELAAARVKFFSPQAIISRLENPGSASSLAVLTGGPRDLPPRQRTLRSAIEWSYNLLTGEEQRLFARLSIFSGGGTLAAIEAICNAREDLKVEVLEAVYSLVSKSLLKQDDAAPGESRFTMLEMIGEFAAERLAADGEEEELHRLHAEYYLALAEAADEDWRRSGRQKQWLDRLRPERHNIRSALKWLLGADRATLALRLAAAMDYFWYTDGQQREGRQWLEEALAAANDAPASVRAAALRAIGHLAQQEVDYRRSIAPLEESLALYKELGDTTAVAGVLKTLAFSAIRHGELERGIALCNEGLALTSGSSLRYEASALLYTIGAAMWHQGHLEQSEQFVTKSLELSREEGNDDMLASGLTALGVIATSQGDAGRARNYYSEGLSIARRIGDQREIAQLTINLAELALLESDPVNAAPLLAEGLGIFVGMYDKEGIAQGLECTAILSHLLEQQDRAVRLFAAAAALREAASIVLPASWAAKRERIVSTIHGEMRSEMFTDLWEQGQSMRVREAIQYARDSITLARAYRRDGASSLGS